MERKTTEEFVKEAKKIHNDFYDYSLVSYINNSTKIKIICPIHGEFEQIPRDHLRGRGCQKCGIKKSHDASTKTTFQFISDARKIHGDYYDYSLVSYTNYNSKIKIICPKHGVFEQKPNSHLNGKGCRLCGFTKNHNKKTTFQFISEAEKIHNNFYDYSLIDYKNCNTKVKIICPIHGVFEQTPDSHLAGSGCPSCSNVNKLNTDLFISKSQKIHNNKYDYSLVECFNNRIKVKIKCLNCGNVFLQKPNNHLRGQGCPICYGTHKKTTFEFIQEAKLIHNNYYDYSLVDYTNYNSKIKIICPKHGVFEQSPKSHLNGAGCPVCSESRGEKAIAKYLIENNIEFEKQKKFPDCKHKRELPFDFYIPSRNLLIEFDGRQHYEVVDIFGGKEELLKVQKRDSIKNEWAKKNGYELLRIRFDENIETRLEAILEN